MRAMDLVNALWHLMPDDENPIIKVTAISTDGQVIIAEANSIVLVNDTILLSTTGNIK